jgi:hypothetical protein
MEATEYEITAFINSLEFFGFYSILVPVAFLMYIHLFSDIAIDESDLQTKYLNKNLSIRWENILGIETVVLFGLFKNPGEK